MSSSSGVERAVEAGATGQAARRLGPISAVVCNYNGEDYLPGCLDALLAQEEALDEILVVDNASEDASLALLRERYPMVKVLPLFDNAGPCAARNAGMRAARNRFVLAIDNDAVLLPDVVGRLRAALEADAEACAVQTRSVFDTEPGRVHYDSGHFHYLGLYALRNFCQPLSEAQGEGVVEVDGIIAIAVLLDARRVLEIGGYDEDYFILFEDFDLALRLRIAGERILSEEEALVRHRGGTPGISFREASYPKIRAYYHSRNRWMLMLKAYRWRTLLVGLPGILLYELVWLAFTAKSGHLRAHCAGKFSFLRSLPSTLAKRRAVQSSRALSDRELYVAGPLTLSPQLVASPLRRRLVGALSALLASWWRLARFAAG